MTRVRICLLIAILFGAATMVSAQAAPGKVKDTPKMYVTAARLNVRIAPDESSTVLGQLTLGSALYVLGRRDEWVQVRYRKGSGWVPSKFLSDRPLGLPVSVAELAGKTPEEVARLLGRDKEQGTLTSSGLVLITGYQYDGWHIQLDHDVRNGSRCIYIGVSFADRPVEESLAWAMAQFSPPPRKQTGRNVIWQGEPGIKPFKLVRRILQSGTELVGKLSFSLVTVEESLKIYRGY